MIATEYAPLARRTLKELPREQHFVHMALGLCGEMGEFIDAIKKNVIYGKALDLVNLTEEAGDDFWYIVNLLTELDVSAAVLQRAIDSGYVGGRQAAQNNPDVFKQAAILLQLNFNVAAIAMSLANQPEMYEKGGSKSVQVVEALGNTLGLLCGMYGLDPAEAMDLNIKKLAKRYGDKYSDVAALNRDLGGERAVLEGGNVHPLGSDVLAFDAAAYGHSAALPTANIHGIGQDAGVHEKPVDATPEGDFELPAKVCDTARPGSCESCQ